MNGVGRPGGAAHAASAILRTLSIAARVLADWPGRAGGTVLLWLDRDRQRRALDSLSEHLLKDLGLSRADVYHEVRKRFWRE